MLFLFKVRPKFGVGNCSIMTADATWRGHSPLGVASSEEQIFHLGIHMSAEHTSHLTAGV